MSKPDRGWAYAAIGFLFVAVMMATTEPTALSVAGDGERGQVSSLFFFIAYVGITIPVIGAGIGVAETSILTSFIIVGSVLAAFDLVALIYLSRRRGLASRYKTQSADNERPSRRAFLTGRSS